jgi:ribosomal protein S16
MPKKGKVLKADEIELVKLWIKNGAHWSDRALKYFPEAALWH